MKLPITREKAIKLLKKFPQTESDFNHYLMSEAIMIELAEKLGEDKKYWGMVGLLHDVDWTLTKENIKKHLTKAPKILKEVGFDSEFISTIVSHGYGFDCAGLLNKKRNRKVEYALAIAETINGLIYAYALMRGRKITDMKIKGLKKKFKDKNFASGVNREIIKECENLKLSLDEFLELSIEAIKKIKDHIGLK